MLQQMQAAMGLIQTLAMQSDEIAAMAMDAGLLSPEQMADATTPMQPAGNVPKGSPEERASKHALDGSYASKIRERSAKAAEPK